VVAQSFNLPPEIYNFSISEVKIPLPNNDPVLIADLYRPVNREPLGMLIKDGGSIKPSSTFSYPSWAVGLPNAILCVEMAAISILHLQAYPYRPYNIYLISLDKNNVSESSTGGEGNERVMAPRRQPYY
jgi:hypothetical protein